MAMTCYHCKSKIINDIHKKECDTVSMFQVKNVIINSDIKKMMTFGLCGCTAIIMVLFDKDTNKPYKIVFGHTPNKDSIIEWYRKYYDINYNIVTIIKSKGNYEKKDDKQYFSLVIDDDQYWTNKINQSNNTLILLAYSNIKSVNLFDFNYEFESSLYLEIFPELQYSDNYGRFIKIVPKPL